MKTDIPRETADKVVDALASGDKELAILLCYRANGEDLGGAWSSVQQILLDLGDSGQDQPSRAAADPSFRNVEYYLKADASVRRKAIVRSALVSIIFLGALGGKEG